MMDDRPIYSKEAIEADLDLIKTCLKLINQSILVSQKEGTNYKYEGNKSLHHSITKIDYVLNSIKTKVDWEENEDGKIDER